MASFFVENWIWCLVAGVWVIHKFKHYLPSGNIEDLGESGTFSSLNEARMKTYKQASKDFPKSEVDIHDTFDESGNYFIITVKALVGEIVDFIFMPIPPPEK